MGRDMSLGACHLCRPNLVGAFAPTVVYLQKLFAIGNLAVGRELFAQVKIEPSVARSLEQVLPVYTRFLFG
jgi:hypothetical protein